MTPADRKPFLETIVGFAELRGKQLSAPAIELYWRSMQDWNLNDFRAAAAQLQPIDTVYVDFRNTDGLRREAEEARRDGFTGKMAIHPAQVPVVNEVFTPSPEAIAKARAIVAAFDAAPGTGTIGIDGVMYDRPHLARAQALLARTKA